MVIKIDYSFPNWNEYINKERANKFAAASMKKKELDIIRYHTIGKKYEGKYPIEVIATWHFKNKRKDLDNCRIKGILDGLVKCNVIENDNLNCIRKIVYESVIDGQEYVEIEMKENV